MMQRTPRNLRSSQSNPKGNMNNPSLKPFVKKNQKPQTSQSEKNSTENHNLNVTFVAEKESPATDITSLETFLSKDDIKKMTIEEQIVLVVNRAIDISNAFLDLKGRFSKDIHDLKEQNTKLKEDNVIMKEKLRDLEYLTHANYERSKQDLKYDECEFWGVIEDSNEDLTQKVIEVAKNFKVDLSPNEISYCSRKKLNVNTRHDIPGAIRVKFYNKRKRDQLIDSGKSMRIPRHSQTDERNGRDFIYINEALTNHFQFIYGKARELKKKKIIDKTWCKQGRIFIQRGSSPPKLVNNLNDLDEFN